MKDFTEDNLANNCHVKASSIEISTHSTVFICSNINMEVGQTNEERNDRKPWISPDFLTKSENDEPI